MWFFDKLKDTLNPQSKTKVNSSTSITKCCCITSDESSRCLCPKRPSTILDRWKTSGSRCKDNSCQLPTTVDVQEKPITETQKYWQHTNQDDAKANPTQIKRDENKQGRFFEKKGFLKKPDFKFSIQREDETNWYPNSVGQGEPPRNSVETQVKSRNQSAAFWEPAKPRAKIEVDSTEKAKTKETDNCGCHCYRTHDQKTLAHHEKPPDHSESHQERSTACKSDCKCPWSFSTSSPPCCDCPTQTYHISDHKMTQTRSSVTFNPCVQEYPCNDLRSCLKKRLELPVQQQQPIPRPQTAEITTKPVRKPNEPSAGYKIVSPACQVGCKCKWSKPISSEKLPSSTIATQTNKKPKKLATKTPASKPKKKPSTTKPTKPKTSTKSSCKCSCGCSNSKSKCKCVCQCNHSKQTKPKNSLSLKSCPKSELTCKTESQLRSELSRTFSKKDMKRMSSRHLRCFLNEKPPGSKTCAMEFSDNCRKTGNSCKMEAKERPKSKEKPATMKSGSRGPKSKKTARTKRTVESQTQTINKQTRSVIKQAVSIRRKPEKTHLGIPGAFGAQVGVRVTSSVHRKRLNGNQTTENLERNVGIIPDGCRAMINDPSCVCVQQEEATRSLNKIGEHPRSEQRMQLRQDEAPRDLEYRFPYNASSNENNLSPSSWVSYPRIPDYCKTLTNDPSCTCLDFLNLTTRLGNSTKPNASSSCFCCLRSSYCNWEDDQKEARFSSSCSCKCQNQEESEASTKKQSSSSSSYVVYVTEDIVPKTYYSLDHLPAAVPKKSDVKVVVGKPPVLQATMPTKGSVSQCACEQRRVENSRSSLNSGYNLGKPICGCSKRCRDPLDILKRLELIRSKLAEGCKEWRYKC